MMNTAPNEVNNDEINALIAPTEADQPGWSEWLDEVHAQTADPSFEDDGSGDGDDTSEFDDEPEPREDHFRDDVDADADALAGAGYGTDEDYGYYGGEDY